MGWQKIFDHAWQDPLALAAEYAGHDMALLYSSRAETYTGQQSFLFLDPAEEFTGASWNALPPLPNEDDGLPLYVGYLGYGLRNDSERLHRGTASFIDLPDFTLRRYARMFRFDHQQWTIEEYRSAGGTKSVPHPTVAEAPQVKELHSNFTRAGYEKAVGETLEQIAQGNFYQANITRKFHGSFTSAPDYFTLFCTLCHASSAPFSAYLRHGDTAILSSSPESFLSIDAAGHITSRPIKGSAPRGEDEASDVALRDALIASPKNQAENLMIVDLMRHDIAHVSDAGSVKVAEQSALYSYPTIHHLVSTITAQKRGEVSAYDVVRACFPPGSMTGAPKIAAMEWCAAQEKMERGVYSGALGWFGSGERCDLSVVIRTLICRGEQFEFQVGGGIVADSTPEDEWRETLIKARGIARALGITEEELEKL